MVVRLVDFTVIVMVVVMVPVNVVKVVGSSSSSFAIGTGRNAPVLGSRYPRMPGLATCLASVWPHSAGTIRMQHMQINSSLVMLIFISFAFCKRVDTRLFSNSGKG